MFYKSFYESKLGKITLLSDGKSLNALCLPEHRYLDDKLLAEAKQKDDLTIFVQTKNWLAAYFEGKNPDKDIHLYINSPGGSVSAGFAIYDTIRYIKCDVVTICVGLAASMGAFLLASGTKGKRYALPNSEIMIHQPLGGMQGQASDIEIHSKHIIKTRERLNKILSEVTGQPIEKINKDTDRDNFMSADEAKAYGLIDDIFYTRKKSK